MAKLNRPARKINSKGSSFGKKALAVAASLLALTVVSTVLLGQPESVQCVDGGKSTNPLNCGCPRDAKSIYARDLLVIDVTDPIPNTKFADIKRIVNEYATRSEDLGSWLFNGKKVVQTSVYFLTDKPPSSMEPSAVFCSQPPDMSFVSGKASSRRAVAKAQNALLQKTERAIEKLRSGAGASQSPIVETLSTLTSNSSAWSPNGSLTLISDLHENSGMCGYLEHQPSVATFPNGLNKQCMATIEQLGANLVNLRVGLPSIAICELPGKPIKPGLKLFWRDMFQSLTQYDVKYSCAPEELLDQRRRVDEIYKKLQKKSSS